MYKAAYGDLKVPSRFIVPAMVPWPEAAWGLKLGQRVASIRSTGKFVQNNETRRKTLEDMGFVWRLRAASPDKDMEGITFDQIYAALITYRQEMQQGTGSLNIPSNFVVPDCDPWPESTRGLPLGKKLPTVRTKTYLKANPGATDKLRGLGFEFDGKVAANDARFTKVYEALKRYKEIYGDLLVPQPFVVPESSDDWPEETWGLRLGARVNAIRSQGTFVNTNPERRVQLEEIGFVWSPPASERGRKRGRRKKEENEALMGPAPPGVLTEGSAAAGDDGTAAPPAGDAAAGASFDEIFGPSFGLTGDPLASQKEIGKTSPTWGFESNGELEAALAAEEAKTPAENEYAEPKLLSETLSDAADRARACGIITEQSDSHRFNKGKRDKDIPWFNDDFGEGFVFEDVLEALTVYKSVNSDFSALIENEEFVIPIADAAFANDEMMDPEESGLGLAAAAATIEEDDMVKDENGGVESDNTLQKAENWPEHLHGMALGNIVRRIRDGSLEVKHLPERKEQLDAIEFDWGDPMHFLDVPFEKAMCAMFAYYLVRGDMFVYEDFVMPDEDPWPNALAGYELGKTVRRLRELQNFMEAYHPEKVTLLRAIDFVWFPTLARPIDPNEADLTPEMLLVSANGHPDYSKMIDIPMGLPDKIIADGPFFETDNPKLWWRKWHSWDHVKDYWYEQGRRDNAFVLRGMGYPQLAEEHEAKYGPGLFSKIEALMNEMEEDKDEASKETKTAWLQQLTMFQEEFDGCKDMQPTERKAMAESLDTAILSLTAEKSEELLGETSSDEEYYEEDEEYEYEDEEYEEEEEVEEEEVELTEELGLE
mmetsp:Transcript_1703/g.1963  ORF Transcript_1703/g.1963 Transcript_1703/m.1963 type:complete len:825 (-) Transcript_1703:100-2574(-)